METCVSTGGPVSESRIVYALIKLRGNEAYSFLNQSVPIAYLSEQPHCMFSARKVVHSDEPLMTHRPFFVHRGDVQEPPKPVALRASILVSAYP